MLLIFKMGKKNNLQLMDDPSLKLDKVNKLVSKHW